MPLVKKRAVKIIRPEHPDARDERPRLIPLKEGHPDDVHGTKLQHYGKLADIALKTPRADKVAR